MKMGPPILESLGVCCVGVVATKIGYLFKLKKKNRKKDGWFLLDIMCTVLLG